MTWFKVDDNLALHPKVLAAGNTAMGLWVRAGAWASAQLTDGFVPTEIITVLGGKKTDADRLINAGLWERTKQGYQFHDWKERNPSRTEVRQARTSRSAAATLANHRRWHLERGITDIHCPHCTNRTTDQSNDRKTDQSTDSRTDQSIDQ